MSDETQSKTENSYYYEPISKLGQGDYIIIRNRPCHIFHHMRLKLGKHSRHTEYCVYGKDLFNGDLYELEKANHSPVKVPVVKKSLYQVKAADDSFLFLVKEDDKAEKHLPIPDDALGQKIRDMLHVKKMDHLIITVVSAMEEDKIEAVSADTDIAL